MSVNNFSDARRYQCSETYREKRLIVLFLLVNAVLATLFILLPPAAELLGYFLPVVSATLLGFIARAIKEDFSVTVSGGSVLIGRPLLRSKSLALADITDVDLRRVDDPYFIIIGTKGGGKLTIAREQFAVPSEFVEFCYNLRNLLDARGKDDVHYQNREPISATYFL